MKSAWFVVTRNWFFLSFFASSSIFGPRRRALLSFVIWRSNQEIWKSVTAQQTDRDSQLGWGWGWWWGGGRSGCIQYFLAHSSHCVTTKSSNSASQAFTTTVCNNNNSNNQTTKQQSGAPNSRIPFIQYLNLWFPIENSAQMLLFPIEICVCLKNKVVTFAL